MSAVESPELSFDDDRTDVAAALESFAGRYLGSLHAAIAAPIRYSMLGEGKRLRAVLLAATYRAAGGTGDVGELAAAVEVVHA